MCGQVKWFLHPMAGLEGASCTLELKIPSRDLLFSFLNSPSFLFAVQGFAFPSDVIRRHFPVFFLVFLGICFSKSCDLTMYVEFRRNSPLFLFAVQGFAFPCDIIHRLFPVLSAIPCTRYGLCIRSAVQATWASCRTLEGTRLSLCSCLKRGILSHNGRQLG